MPDRHARFRFGEGFRRAEKQKTRREGRVFVDTREKRATAYPARSEGSGRRAREVMPAAMRALVRVSAAEVAAFIVG
jgi:hypothetical protein